MSKELKSMKQTLLAAAQSQMGNLSKVNAKELGEVIDMIKDLEEAEYYCAIVEAMEKSQEDKKESEKISSAIAQNQQYYTPYPYMKYLDPRYDEDERMWYGGKHGTTTTSVSMGEMGMPRRYYEYIPSERTSERDEREGKSPITRRGYMEGKEMHSDKNSQLQKLEKYVNELTNDIVEMTKDSSPEEKTMLHQKLAVLANKIQ